MRDVLKEEDEVSVACHHKYLVDKARYFIQLSSFSTKQCIQSQMVWFLWRLNREECTREESDSVLLESTVTESAWSNWGKIMKKFSNPNNVHDTDLAETWVGLWDEMEQVVTKEWAATVGNRISE